jgi:hypothetical protein
MSDERIGRALRDAPVPDEAGAAERGLRVVRAAAGGDGPGRHRPPRLRRLGVALLASALVFVVVLTPVGADVRDFVKDVVEDSEPDPTRSLTRVPGGGELLVESDDGPWVVRADGSQRLLGDFSEATWSPHGLFVAVTDGGRLSAVDPAGNPRWTVTRSAMISAPRWSPSGFRVAYRAGQQLRVVAGDGTGDRLLTRRAAGAPAWRPGAAHVLAYASPAGVLRAINTDTGEILLIAKNAPEPPLALAWSDDGTRLLAVMRDRIRVFSSAGRRLHLIRPLRARAAFTAAAWEPGSHRIAYLQRYRGAAGPRTELVLVGSAAEPRQLIAGHWSTWSGHPMGAASSRVGGRPTSGSSSPSPPGRPDRSPTSARSSLPVAKTDPSLGSPAGSSRPVER